MRLGSGAASEHCSTRPACRAHPLAAVHVNMCTGLVAEVRHLLAACPRRLVPRLGTDGRCVRSAAVVGH